MRRSRRDSRTRLNISHDIQPEVLGKVWPGAVVGDNLRSAIRGHLCQPFFISLSQPLFEILFALLEVGLVARIHFSEFCSNTLGDAPPIIRIEPIVRIAQWMHVAFSPRELALGNLQNLGELRGVQVSRRPRLDSSVAALRSPRSQPADVQVE